MDKKVFVIKRLGSAGESEDLGFEFQSKDTASFFLEQHLKNNPYMEAKEFIIIPVDI